MIGRFAPTPEVEPPKPKGFDDFELCLGDIMRGERATLGKSLLDVQRELKIKATYIAAIENCDPSAFETPGFIAGYVRSYARYLGMDPDKAFADFCAESNFRTADGLSAGASAPAPKPVRSAGQDPLADPNATFVPRGEALISHIEPGAIGSVAVLLALIGMIGFGGWTVLQEIQRVDFTPAEDVTGVAADIDPLSGVKASEPATALPEEMRRAAALDRLYRPEALDVPVLEPRDGPIAAVDPSSYGALAEMTARASSATAAASSGRGERQLATEKDTPEIQVVEEAAPELVLVAVRPAWVRVRGAGGTVLLEKVLDAGEEYVLPQTEEPPTLRVGESGAVYFAVNGQHYGPAGPDGVVTKDIVLAADALTGAYDLADASRDSDLARMVAEAAAPVEQPAE